MRINKNVIFAITGCVGVASSVYFAIKDTKKNLDILDRIEEGPMTKELVIDTGKAFWKTLLSSGLTIASIIGSNVVSAKTIAALTGALSYMTLNRDTLVSNVRKYVPNGNNLVKESAVEALTSTPVRFAAEETGNGDVLCLEGYSGRYFRSSLEAVSDALRRFADRFENGEYVNFNNLYQELDIEETRFGDDWGYAPGSYLYDTLEPFEYEIEELSAEDHVAGKFAGERIILIDILTRPCECYMEI